jgi:hypothetical protein
MFERNGKTWMWLADSGINHHMTSVRRDFCEYRALTYRLWVKGISARAVGVGSVRIIVISPLISPPSSTLVPHMKRRRNTQHSSNPETTIVDATYLDSNDT